MASLVSRELLHGHEMLGLDPEEAAHEVHLQVGLTHVGNAQFLEDGPLLGIGRVLPLFRFLFGVDAEGMVEVGLDDYVGFGIERPLEGWPVLLCRFD